MEHHEAFYDIVANNTSRTFSNPFIHCVIKLERNSTRKAILNMSSSIRPQLTKKTLNAYSGSKKLSVHYIIFSFLLFYLIEISLGAPIADILQHNISSMYSVISGFGYLSISA